MIGRGKGFCVLYVDVGFRVGDMTVKSSKTMNPLLIGIILVIVDSFFFGLMSLFVRLSGDLPTMQKAFFRNFVAFLVAFITLYRNKSGFHIPKDALPDLLKRSIFGATGMIMNFWAIDHIALADANILNKMSPFFAIIASIPILHEIPNAFEIVTVVVAFIGSIFVVRPGMQGAGFASLIGLMGGACAGFAYTYVRKLGKHKVNGALIVGFFSLFTCLICLPEMVMSYVPMTPVQWGLLLGAGLSAAIAQFAVTNAYKYAPAKVISVFDYSQVLFAGIWGVFLFHEIPTSLTILGYCLILGMAILKWLYTLQQEKVQENKIV